MAALKRSLLSRLKKLIACSKMPDTNDSVLNHSVSNGSGSVSKGFKTVFVGKEKTEYRLPVQYTWMPEFSALVLKNSPDEAFGLEFVHESKAPMVLPCTDEELKHFLELA
ncbi:hypothetical protein IFM89_001967 [Coptis chinensis]|uniref:Uncharacterized protein n=1 Tax=Coptis chinensis TaxID=261450 RepID=A0A835LPD2_9MAGN|nr:hypothetical protein IFM89_001967 [Coptis chinensis]